MIAKRTRDRKDGTGSYKYLTQYILKRLEKGEGSIANCNFDTIPLAVKEIEATQAMNQRTRNDKTYHLVISFQENEHPEPAVLQAIEEEMVASLGFKEHQRISALHTNTENLHIHVAINKIHPETYHIIEPHYDYLKLAETCVMLEKKYGLRRDNHLPDHQKEQWGAIELSGKGQSFVSWVREAVSDHIKHMDDWQNTHQFLAKYNLVLRKRGNGLVFSDRDMAIFTKASEISREFSLTKMEKRLGGYEAPNANVQAMHPEVRYFTAGNTVKKQKTILYDQYLEKRNHIIVVKRKKLQAIKAQQNREKEQLKSDCLKRRQAIKLRQSQTKETSKALYSLLAMERAVAMTKIIQTAQKAREEVHSVHRHQTWREFLREEASKGNEMAVVCLGSGKYFYAPDQTNTITGHRIVESKVVLQGYHYRILDNGDVKYILDNGARFKDTGRQLVLGEQATKESIEAALVVAMTKFGSALEIGGTEAFKKQVITMINQRKYNITILPEKGKHLCQKNTHDAVQDYINQRNITALKVKDLLPHRKFSVRDAGYHNYNGLRHVEGQPIALFKKEKEMLVLPVNRAKADTLKRLSIGKRIKVNAQGHIISRKR